MYDVVVIGSGAAGIECAKQARKARLHTALVDIDKDSFGGTCINSGCIPTKFFLNAAKTNKSWNEIRQEKDTIIEGIKIPLRSFLEKQGVEFFWGKAYFLDKNTIRVNDKTITSKYIVIATGSRPKTTFQEQKAISAGQLFELRQLPEKILVIGAGYIGIEIASLLHRVFEPCAPQLHAAGRTGIERGPLGHANVV